MRSCFTQKAIMAQKAADKAAKELGHIGYKYAHDYPKHYVNQQYLPDPLVGESFYAPGDIGYERDIKKWLEYIKGS